jgi:hypothetical protein
MAARCPPAQKKVFRKVMMYRFLRAAPLSLLLLLGSCSTWDSITSYINSDSTSKCPDAMILAPTASLPAFDPSKGLDPSNLQYRVSLTNVTTRCDYDKGERVADTQLHVFFHATRPPGGRETNYRVPYFVAVTADNGDIEQKNIYWMDVSFEQGAVSADGDAVVDSIPIAVKRDKQPINYHLLAGFQLTKEQLEYNDKIGHYEP